MGERTVTWVWIERLAVLGGIIVSLTLYISASRAGLSEHEAVDTQRRDKQVMVDEGQNKRLDKLEILMEKAIDQQQTTNRTLDRLANALEQQQSRKP